MNTTEKRRKSLMPNTINEYFQPSSTKSHSNIDDLILQAELDTFAQTGSMREDKTPRYIGGTDDVVANIALSPIMTLKSMGNVGRKILEKTGLRNPVSHYTTGQGATNILDKGSIYGTGKFPGRASNKQVGAVSVTRDPMFTSRPHGSIGTDIRLVLDRDEMVKKGLKIKPYAETGGNPGYSKTLNDYSRPPITLESYRKIHGQYPNQMNPRFEFEERIGSSIPTENIKLIDILQLPLGESDFSPNMLKLLGQLSRTNIPIIKSSLAKNRLSHIPIGRAGTFEDIYKIMETPTYKFDPFEKVR